MPRVFRLINRFNLGGPTFNAAYLTRYLPSEFETLLVGGMKDASEDSSEFILNNLGITPTIIPEMRREVHLKTDRKAYKKVKALMKEFKPDIVHTHASKAGALGRLAAAELKVPVILHTFHGHVFHSYFSKAKTTFYKKTERYLAARSSRIIAISDLQKQELVNEHKICAPEKVVVVPLGFDLSRFRENMEDKRTQFRHAYQLEDDEIAIAIIGRLVPIKNHELFLNALQEVAGKTSRKIRAFIVGDGEERQRLETIAKTLQLDFATPEDPRKALLTFTSWIKDVDRVNAGVDLVALTSKNEGTPVSLIEAQAANKPIVSTNVGGIENVVIPNETALLSPNEDAHAFAQNLLQLIENDEQRQQMAANSWNHVKEKFHYQRLVNDMAQLYHHLLNQH